MTRITPVTPDIEDLVCQHYAAVQRLALSILGDIDEAEDATQETFIAAARALPDYRGESSARTWLFAIAVNTCRAALRRRKSRSLLQHTLMGVQAIFSRSPGVEQTAEARDRDDQLWAAVDALDEKHRLAVLLRYAQALPVSEIARVLGVSEGTVHSRLHYARQRLVQQLDDAGWMVDDREDARWAN